jgi:hypothetical protein
MSSKVFDQDTLLDLTVNVIPLVIIGAFIIGFLVMAPFGIDPIASTVQFGLLAVPFSLLTILTYLSGRAISKSEEQHEKYLPGQANMDGAVPFEEHAAVSEHNESAGVEET